MVLIKDKNITYDFFYLINKIYNYTEYAQQVSMTIKLKKNMYNSGVIDIV